MRRRAADHRRRPLGDGGSAGTTRLETEEHPMIKHLFGGAATALAAGGIVAAEPGQ